MQLKINLPDNKPIIQDYNAILKDSLIKYGSKYEKPNPMIYKFSYYNFPN